MIDAEEAGRRARKLVQQFVIDGEPEDEADYIRLVQKLAVIVGATLTNLVGPDEAARQLRNMSAAAAAFQIGQNH